MESIYTLSEEQEILRKQTRDFLAVECPKKLVREMEKDAKGYPQKLWNKIAELGWLGLVFPEKYGGGGSTFLSLVVLIEEIGRGCMPGPFSPTVIGGMTILDAGNEKQRMEFLPALSRGELILGLALTEPVARYDPTAIQTKATLRKYNYVVSGTKLPVPYADAANLLLCAARTKEKSTLEQGITLFLVDGKAKGVSYTIINTIDGAKQYSVNLEQVSLPKGYTLGIPNQAWREIKQLTRRTTLAQCAEMVGGAQQVAEMTIDYAKHRIQFARPIGQFQAVHNRLAEMIISLDGARFLTYQAASMLSKGLCCDKEIAMAKAWTSEAYQQIATSGGIVHGGISATLDHDLQLYYRRAKTAELTFGDADFHRDMIALNLGLRT